MDFEKDVYPMVRKSRGLIYRELKKGGGKKESWRGFEPTEEIIEDLIQDSLVEAWRRFGKFDPTKSSLSTWVGWIVRGRVLNWKKHHSRLPKTTSEPFEYSDITDPLGELEKEDAMRGLSDKERIMADLRIGGYSSQEIASIIGSTENSVNTQLSLLRSKMHE